MKKSFVLFIFLFLIFSCKRNNHSQYVSEDSMKVIIWEMTCADELSKKLQQDEKLSLNNDVTKDTLYQKIFAIHNISSKQFYDSYNYYRNNPKKFKTIMDSALTYGQRQRSLVIQHVKEPIPTSPPKNEQSKDSLKKMKIKLKPLKFDKK